MLSNLQEILEPAVRDNFAVGGFNITGSTMLKAIVGEVRYRKALAIIQVSPNEFQLLKQELYLYLSVRLQRSGNPSVLHYDHNKPYKGCVRAIQAGFISVMSSDSQMEYNQNTEYTHRVAEAAHEADVPVEGEIGTIGETEDYLNGTVRDMVYTSSELVRWFVEDTGVGTLAVSIGTVRGTPPKRYTPKLQLGFLKELAAAAPMPLVLHGGSGTSHDEVAAARRTGIYKVNISSESKHVYYQSIREFITNHPALVSPTRVLKDIMQEARNVAGTKIQVLNSTGKSHCYRGY